jgi:hypothetical protein
MVDEQEVQEVVETTSISEANASSSSTVAEAVAEAASSLEKVVHFFNGLVKK